jgi:hypothetical protein
MNIWLLQQGLDYFNYAKGNSLLEEVESTMKEISFQGEEGLSDRIVHKWEVSL